MSSGYRLAPALAARLVGLVLVGSAAVVLATTALTAFLDWPVGVVVAVALATLLATGAVALATLRIPLLSVDEDGYRVRWVRGAGAKAAVWRDVEDAVTASPHGVDCLVLRLRDGRTTSLPVSAIAEDREAFVEEIRGHLGRGHGLRPL